MADSSDSDWGADVPLDGNVPSEEDADDWLKDATDTTQPVSIPQSQLAFTDNSTIASQASTPANSIKAPPFPARTNQEAASTPPPRRSPPHTLTPTSQHNPPLIKGTPTYQHIQSPRQHNSHGGGITPATPINPLFLEEGGGGDYGQEEDQGVYHQVGHQEQQDGSSSSVQQHLVHSYHQYQMPSDQQQQRGQEQGRQWHPLSPDQQLQVQGKQQQQHAERQKHYEPPTSDLHGLQDRNDVLQGRQQHQAHTQPAHEEHVQPEHEQSKHEQESSETEVGKGAGREATQQQRAQNSIRHQQHETSIEQHKQEQPDRADEQQKAHGPDVHQKHEESAKDGGGWGWAGGWGSRLRAAAAAAVAVAAPLAPPPHTQQGNKAAAGSVASEDTEHRNQSSTNPPGLVSASRSSPNKPTQGSPQSKGEEEVEEEGLATDEDLERGLQAIDEQVERLGGALSSWWGGLNRNTASIMSKVEGFVSSNTLQNATNKVKGFEKRIEAVGRNALHLLEDLTGQYNHNLDALQAQGEDGEPGDFQSFFALYGGQQLCTDLEALANDCARICNRARSRLEDAQQKELDSTLAELGPILSARLDTRVQVTDQSHPRQQLSIADAEVIKATEQMDQRYAPISYLSEDSHTRAQAYKHMLLEAAGQLHQQQHQQREDVNEEQHEEAQQQQQQQQQQQAGAQQQEGKGVEVGEGSSKKGARKAAAVARKLHAAQQVGRKEGGERLESRPGHGSSSVPEDGGAASERQAEDTAINSPLTTSPSTTKHAEGPCFPSDSSPRHACTAHSSMRIKELLGELRAHATKRLAELATAQLQLLLDHGTSLSAPARSSQQFSTPSWPSSPSAQGYLLHELCTRMVVDLHAAAQANVAVALALIAALPGAGEGNKGGVTKGGLSEKDGSVKGAVTEGVGAGKDAESAAHGEAVVADSSAEGGVLSSALRAGSERRASVEEGEKGKGSGSEGGEVGVHAAGSKAEEGSEDLGEEGIAQREQKGGGDEEGGGIREDQVQYEPGRLAAIAHTLQVELQAAAHSANAHMEEALRGLLYCVLVRHLVLGVAGKGGEGEGEQKGVGA